MLLIALAWIALDPQQVIALEGDTHHVQGIVVDGSRLWVTSVDRPTRKGFLFEYELPSGKRLRAIEIQDGDRYHPGGLDATKDSLWIPVAEYRRASTAVIQKRNKKTLALEAQFLVNDHIGCVAAAKGRLYGGNWDSKQIYEWSFDGRELAKRDRTSNVSYQDIKFRKSGQGPTQSNNNPVTRAAASVARLFYRSKVVASGLRGNGTGAVDFLDPKTLRILRTIEFEKTDRAVVYTHEGMDLQKGLMYLLPEDAPSRLFVFRP